MLNPAIGKLIENSDNNYSLVMKIANEARKISEQATASGEIIIEKPVSLAINKFASEIKD